jgi:hypothetical protein
VQVTTPGAMTGLGANVSPGHDGAPGGAVTLNPNWSPEAPPSTAVTTNPSLPTPSTTAFP